MLKVYAEIYPDLERFGHRVATDIFELHKECARDPPRLETFNSWGKRIDNIITCPAWKTLKSISAEEGLIAIAYERKQEQWRSVIVGGYLAHYECNVTVPIITLMKVKWTENGL